MSFEHPGFLWGLLAALIPLAVHLFDRRRAKPLKFAAIDFVLRSQKRTARRLRLKRLLLYALRTLLFLAIPLALARPHRTSAKTVAAAPRGPMATAIVLDASLSMRYQHNGRSLFESARELARDALAGLTAEEPVAVVICKQPFSPPGAPGFDRAAARRALDEAQVSAAPADVGACLSAAAASLAESPLPGKRIVLASDLTQGGLRLDGPPPAVRTAKGEVRPEVVLLDAARGAEALPNATVSDLRIEPEPALGSRGFAFSFTVRNHGPQPLKDLTASLKIEGRVAAKGVLDVPAHGSAQKTLAFRFPEGGYVHGSVEIAHDGLAEDDARHFTLKVPREIKALVVDGAPATLRFQDEAFFVDAALSAPGSPVHATTVDLDTFAQAPLAPGLDVVLLLNCRALPPARVTELRAFVEAGGGLFMSLGPNVDPDAYDQAMAPLLPRPLRLVKTAAERGQPGAEGKAARFTSVNWGHPAFGVFTGDAREGLLAARTYAYFLLEPGSAGEVSVLASYDDGAPAFAEAVRGRGRIVLDTSTVSREWSDLPIRPAFLPLLQRFAGYLAGALDEREVRDQRVGEPHPLEPVRQASGAPALPREVKGPDGKPRPILAAQSGQPAQVAQTDLPGIYAVTPPPGAAVEPGALDFAVNVDPAEGDLARHDPKELVAYFGEGTKTQTGAGDEDQPQHRTPAWTGLLVLAALVLTAEGGLLAKP